MFVHTGGPEHEQGTDPPKQVQFLPDPLVQSIERKTMFAIESVPFDKSKEFLWRLSYKKYDYEKDNWVSVVQYSQEKTEVDEQMKLVKMLHAIDANRVKDVLLVEFHNIGSLEIVD